MSKRVITHLVATAGAAAVLAVATSAATASSPASATAAKKAPVVNIVMKDPGCHWFSVAGKNKARLAVNGPTTFRNLDEAALIFKGKNFTRRVAVGKSLTVANAGVYHIVMVGQPSDDNTLVLVVK